jgi:hypothetical protein
LKWRDATEKVRQIFRIASLWPRYVFKDSDAHEFKPTMAEIEEKPVSPLGRVVY